jgi:hypothetical protein
VARNHDNSGRHSSCSPQTLILTIFDQIWNQISPLALPAALYIVDGGLMPSSEYYRRQADTLLALALNTSEPDLSNWCRNLALQYKLLAEKRTTDPVPDPEGTPPRVAGEAEAEGQ